MNPSIKHALRLASYVVAMGGTLLLVGCVTTPVKPKYPSTVQDWNGIDRVEFLTDCVVGISRDLGKLLTLAGT